MEMKLPLLIICLAASAVMGVQVQKCRKGSIPTKLEIEGCTKPPCKIVNGQNLRFNAEFVNPTPTKTLTAKVIARVAGLIIPYELPAEHRDGCQKLTNAECPLGANQLVAAAGDVPVESPIVNVKANIEFQLVSDSGVAVCFKIDAKIVKQ
ncbi:mite group 2 allergen Lep d 2-like [Armigeres subalbatus]|uniref:mite group 2 allergen Lep d 2-like n=1 Tax=Armigeres subalbatus TaxID=124917 RepID=UPI002ED4A9A1